MKDIKLTEENICIVKVGDMIYFQDVCRKNYCKVSSIIPRNSEGNTLLRGAYESSIERAKERFGINEGRMYPNYGTGITMFKMCLDWKDKMGE